MLLSAPYIVSGLILSYRDRGDILERYSILILNGPNLNGVFKTELRAFATNWLDEVEELCREQAVDLDVSLDFRQSNHEGEIVDWIHDGIRSFDGIIINPSSYSHTSHAIRDALSLAPIPVVEVQLSNVIGDLDKKVPVTAGAADILIAGADDYGYLLAMDAVIQMLDKNKKEEV